MLCSYPYKQIALKDWDGDKLKWSHPCCNMSRPEWEDPMGMQDIDKLTPPEIFESEQFKLLRDDFDNNRKNDFCKTCWNMEERNIEPFYIHNDDIIYLN